MFEDAVERALGEHIRENDQVACNMWSALANARWEHASGETVSYTFRAAGDLVAAIRGSGDYMDWYCSGPYPHADPAIATALAVEGWTWRAA
jgi:hypothetical protein